MMELYNKELCQEKVYITVKNLISIFMGYFKIMFVLNFIKKVRDI